MPSVRFGLQTALSVLQHRFYHFSGHAGKPAEEFVDPRTAFKIFKQCLDRYSRAAKYPCAAPTTEVAQAL